MKSYKSPILLAFLVGLLPLFSSGQTCNITVSPNAPRCPGVPFSFTATTNLNDGPVTYQWNFGDGNFGNGQSVSHAYAFNSAQTTYTVQLIVADTVQTCTTTQSVTVLYGPQLNSGGNFFDPSFCVNALPCSTTFTTNIDITGPGAGVIPFVWDFGDGSPSITSTNMMETHTYTDFGTFTLTVTAVGSNCPSVARDVQFYTRPQNPDISTPGNNFCENQLVTVENDTNIVQCPGNVEYYVVFWDYDNPPSTVPSDTFFSLTNIQRAYDLPAGDVCGTFFPSVQRTIRLEAENPCTRLFPQAKAWDSNPVNIAIAPEPDFIFPQPLCWPTDSTVNFTNNSCPTTIAGQPLTYEWNFGDPASGANNTSTLETPSHTFSGPGTYNVTLTATNSQCGARSVTRQVVIQEPPSLNIIPDADSGCGPLTIGYRNLSTPPGLIYNWQVSPSANISPNPNADSVSITYPGPGVYYVSTTATNGCGQETFRDTITVLREPTVAVDPIGDSCRAITLSPSASVDNNLATTISYAWDFGAGSTPASSNSLIPGQVQFPLGNQTVSLTATNECGSNSSSVSFGLFPISNVDIGPDDTLCLGDSILCLPASPAGGFWLIDGVPDTAGCINPIAAGVFELVYTFDTTLTTVNNLFCRSADTSYITVSQPPVVNAGTNQSICEGDTAILGGFPSGGTFYLNGNPIGNEISPDSAGIYTISYIFIDSAGCEGIDDFLLTVNSLPVVDAGTPLTFCPANQVENIGTNASPAGGSWNGPGLINPNGDINPGNLGLGTYNYTYTYTDPATSCVNTDTLTVVIENPQLPLTMRDTSLCRNNLPLSLMATPPGGVWSGGNGGLVLPNALDPSLVVGSMAELYYTVLGGQTCEATDTLRIIVNDTLSINAGLDSSRCADADTVTLSGFSPLNGNWSGPGIVSPNPGSFLPALVPAGSTVELYYTVVSDSGCISRDFIEFEVDTIPLVNGGPDLTYCITGGPQQIPGFIPSNGNWTGPGVSPGGLFDPTISGIKDTFLLIDFTDLNGCYASDTVNISVIEPDSIFAGVDTAVCVSEAPFVIPGFFPTNGSWYGNGINQASGLFDPAQAGVGLHELIYVIAEATSCEQQDTLFIRVDSLPIVEAGMDLETCVGSAPVTLTGGSPAASGMGAWNGFNVSPIGGGQYIFDPSVVGNFPLTYTFIDNNGCADSSTLNFEVYNLPVVEAGPDTIICSTGGPQQLANYSPQGGTWMGPHVDSAGIFTPDTLGTFKLFYRIVSTTGNNCENQDSMFVTVIAPDSISAGPNDSVCLNNGLDTLGNFFPLPPNGVWSGPGIVDPVLGVFDPAVAGVGSFNLIYCTGTGSCLVCDTLIKTVLPLPNVSATPDSMCITDPPLLLENGFVDGVQTIGNWSGPGVNFAGGTTYTFGPLPDSTYEVVYSFTDSLGCTNWDSTTVKVNPQPVAGIFAPNLICTMIPTTFGSLSTNAVGFYWDFGVPMATSTQENPVYTYADTGTYTVTLIATSPSGCTDTTTTTVVVSEIPEPGFDLGVDSTCALAGILPNGKGGIVVNITDTSNAAGGTYFWEYGGGIDTAGMTSSTLQTPPPIYFEQGPDDTTYTITLTIINDCDSVSTQRSLTIHPLPQVTFIPDTSVDCSPFCPIITNLSQGNTDSYIWQYDTVRSTTASGTVVSTDSLPQNFCLFHLPPNGQSDYRIFLIGQNTCGSDTAYHDVTVLPNNVNATFNVDRVQGCPPLTINAISLANAPNSWFAFGDPNQTTTSDDTTSFTYTEPGTYMLRHAAFNSCAADTDTIMIVVLPVEEVGILAEDGVSCPGIPVRFSDSIASANVTGYFWDFGDSTNSSQGSPVHVYDSAGTYRVILTAQSILGPNSCPTSDTVLVQILPKPEAFFSASDTFGCPPLNVSFGNVPAGPGLSYFWEFGDNTTGVGPNPNHTYTTSGNFTVQLTVFNADSCFDTFSTGIQVFQQPRAVFSWSRTDSCGGNDSIFFTNNSLGGLLSYNWDFGDGNGSTAPNPGHAYSQAGTYVVSLVSQTAFGCADTTRDTIIVYPQPQASIDIIPQSGCSPLDASVEVVANNYTGFRVDFGDQTNTSTPFTNQNHTYTATEPSSVFQASLYLNYENACFDTARAEVRVNSRPVASFSPTLDTLCGAPNSVGFFNQSSDIVGGLRFEWDFGDGNTSTPTNPTHTYNQTNNYQVQLIALNDSGCADTAYQRVVVLPQPRANIIADQSTGCYDLPVQFGLAQPDSATNWRWDFGDNSQTEGIDNPLHTFRDEGDYIVRVDIDTAGYCTDSDTILIRVGPPPLSRFDYTVDANSNCGDTLFVSFQNGSVNADAFRWDFGNGVRNSESDPSMFYTRPDSYRISLIAINTEFGCRDTSEDFIRYLRPKAEFELEPLLGCTPLAVIPNNLTQGANTYSWDFGDGTSRDPRENPSHVYQKAGEFDVTLYASFSNICIDTFTFPLSVRVSQSPEALITATELGTPGLWLFSDSSQVTNPPYTVEWDFGDGTRSNEFAFTHQFMACGPWDVSLLVTDALGCAGTDTLKGFEPNLGTLAMPNALAPNAGPGAYSVFWPRGMGLDSIHIAIYNDWGELIWERKSHDESGNLLEYQGVDGSRGPVLDENGSPSRIYCAWDGHVEHQKNGQKITHPVIPGAYTWVIHSAWFCGGREFNGKRQGTVTLLSGN